MEEKKLLLIVDLFWLRSSMFLALLGVLQPVNAEKLPTPIVSKALTQEAKTLKDDASRLKKAYEAEAHTRSNDTKKVMREALSDVKSFEGTVQESKVSVKKSPCCSSLSSEEQISMMGEKCLVSASTIKAEKEETKTYEETAEMSAQTTPPLGSSSASLALFPEEQILVFVSFSMPEEVLRQLSKTLKDHPEVKLVLRGLIEDSLEKTVRKIKDLDGVMEINPHLFDAYAIQTVPTFVLIKKDKPAFKLSGNITLPYAKALFAEKGNYAS